MYATNQSLVNFKAMTIYMWEALLAERGIYVEPKTKVLKMGVKKTRPRRHPPEFIEFLPPIIFTLIYSY